MSTLTWKFGNFLLKRAIALLVLARSASPPFISTRIVPLSAATTRPGRLVVAARAAVDSMKPRRFILNIEFLPVCARSQAPLARRLDRSKRFVSRNHLAAWEASFGHRTGFFAN